ncbi:22573_t:CDS:1 [Gigaspora margarita]|uniref:22573_t:CDS:1 n=1 Tax=Gigaspora margarita TaxID=4874 RepID=A0ABN7UWE5_GIGMA|nr:22573_t:CDS:1 [Gigaspora margarita]
MTYYLFIHFFFSFLVLKALLQNNTQNYAQFTQCPGQYPITFNTIYVTDPIIIKKDQNTNVTIDVTSENSKTSVPIVQGAIMHVIPLVNGIEFAGVSVDFCQALYVSNGHPCPYNGTFNLSVSYTDRPNLLPGFQNLLNNTIVKGKG